MKRLPLALVLFAALLAGCQSEPVPNSPSPEGPNSPAPAPADLTQWSGQYRGGDAFSVRALRTGDEWAAFWRQVGRDAPRPLNMTAEMAVAIALGERRTGGYTVEIVRVYERGGQLVVEYREEAPGPDMMVTQALTAPWVVAIVPRSELPVTAQKAGDSPRPRQQK
jgi:hypothetical protein